MKRFSLPLFFILLCAFAGSVSAQQSHARIWNEELLEAIRHDTPRPTVHARNMFHVGMAMWDCWAAYDDTATTVFLDNNLGGYYCPFSGVVAPANAADVKAAREEALSYASYRLMSHRFAASPGATGTLHRLDSVMLMLGYDTSYHSTDYTNNNAAALGNYIAEQIIDFGYQDLSNEVGNYASSVYTPVNAPMVVSDQGNPNMTDLDRWQPLTIGGNTQGFLSPHWGQVTPFSLTDADLTINTRDGFDYWVYHDPGTPPAIDTVTAETGFDDDYKWTHTLVALWSGHLDPDLPATIDISPASRGNVTDLPDNMTELRNFYNLEDGGVQDMGYSVNPSTGMPYTPNVVPLGDYGRVVAEFWADGPHSETPPGHWFTLFNYVSDHPMVEKRFKGTGPVLDDLQWDIKGYLALGGAMHDVAVAVWGVKSWYDFVRPISSIRSMAALGQCSDSTADNYHPGGIPLVPNRIESIQLGDPLEGTSGENIGKIKIFAWGGPDSIGNPDSSYAGVDWILAENWWPYQKPTFVTPPFAGYVSGHSTFSRAAAEVITLFTGDEYFPGGMGEWEAPVNNYLSFEHGPSVTVTLQWARYRDASDEASLSRIWGGIHPPVDDVPGRQMGIAIGTEAFDFAEAHFNGSISGVEPIAQASALNLSVAPNPFSDNITVRFALDTPQQLEVRVYNLMGRTVAVLESGNYLPGNHQLVWNGTSDAGSPLPKGIYLLDVSSADGKFNASKRIVLAR